MSPFIFVGVVELLVDKSRRSKAEIPLQSCRIAKPVIPESAYGPPAAGNPDFLQTIKKVEDQ